MVNGSGMPGEGLGRRQYASAKRCAAAEGVGDMQRVPLHASRRVGRGCGGGVVEGVGWGDGLGARGWERVDGSGIVCCMYVVLSGSGWMGSG